MLVPRPVVNLKQNCDTDSDSGTHTDSDNDAHINSMRTTTSN